MNFDDLVRVSDVIPPSVSLPTIGNHLDESAAERGVRYMGDAVAIGLDIQFDFLVLPEGAFDGVEGGSCAATPRDADRRKVKSRPPSLDQGNFMFR